MITKYFSVFFAILLTSGMIAGSQSAFAGFPCPPGFTPNPVSGLCEMPANASCPPPSVGPNAAGMCETQSITACPVGGALILFVCLDGPACFPGFILNPSGNCDDIIPPTCPPTGTLQGGICVDGPPFIPGFCLSLGYTDTGGICTAPPQCVIGNFNGQTCESPNLCPALYAPNQGTGLCEAQPTQSCLSPSVGPNPTSGLCDQPPALSCTQGTLMGMVCTLEQLASEIGGKIMGVNSSALLLAGATTTSAWLIPVLISAVGIGIVLVRRE